MHQETPRTKKARSTSARVLQLIIGIASLYVLLLIPDRNEPRAGAGRTPFTWNRNSWWVQLEKQFAAARASGCEAGAANIQSSLDQLRIAASTLHQESLDATNAIFAAVETNVFQLAPLIAACPQRLHEYVASVTAIRNAVKQQSQRWDLATPTARETLYRALFGSRMALEEVMLQAPPVDALTESMAAVGGEATLSSAPVARVLGLALRSGDILVSRGGAATSAMIARANDYPGSFSHVALLHVDDVTGKASIIESLSSHGVVVTSVEDFLQDKKLRILVLRVRADLPAVIKDPVLPHRAARDMLAAAKQKHIPYDFTLNHEDHTAQFCSEVAAAAYERHGIHLWTGLTYISVPTAIGWLGSLGVQRFETKEPAELEYDPQLSVVGEWREPGPLFKAHIDDAVTDVMLEMAISGAPLDYSVPMLPVARLVKGYSFLLNCFGRVGPIPEGMSATAALRVERYKSQHAELAIQLERLAQRFQAQAGYPPPYWELVNLAKQAYHARGKR